MTWHTQTVADTLEKLTSGEAGLSSGEATRRLERYGKNQLTREKPTSPWKILFSQFTDFMILILIAAAILAGVAGEWADSVIILVIILANAIIGFFQEYRASKALEALSKMAAPQTKVIRGGETRIIPSELLVPGDIVLLEAGQIVPADLRLIEAWTLKISEAALTGESDAVEKTTDPLSGNTLALGDRTNLAYKSTLVASGRGKGVVTETGMNTEFGKIAGLLGNKDQTSPLQIRMEAFGKKLTWAILGLCVVLFGIGWIRQEEILNLMLTVISMAVAAIPEALPVVITVSLALGARKMARQQVLVRKLSAIESLGSVTCICSDKTGTLTENRMSAEKHWIHPEKEAQLFQYTICLNHDVEWKETLQGEPTEVALVELAERLNWNPQKVFMDIPRVGEIPFDSSRKRMSTIHVIGQEYYLLVKGAPESIFPITTEETGEASGICESWAAEGYRVLGMAGRKLRAEEIGHWTPELEKNLTLYGLTGLQDPPRKEVPDAIQECHDAGVRTIMITGDHPKTAMAIAQKTGILRPGSEAISMTGAEMEASTDTLLLSKLKHANVFARVSPEQKFRLVKLLQQKGEFVAMTGDGVNDAPALEKAHVGIAMGITGTEVTREAADLVLLDDNFATIAKAIKHGRTIYNNLRKFIRYALTCNSGELWTLILAPFLGLPIPLLPIHILWINLVTDGLPGIALSSEPSDTDIMKQPPRKPGESIFAGGLGIHVIWVGGLMGLLSIFTAWWTIASGLEHWQTMVFTVLCFAQMFHVITIRAERTPLFHIPFFRNPALPGAVLLTFILQLIILYVPLFNDWFKTDPLTLKEILICIGTASVVAIAVEIEKILSVVFKSSLPDKKHV
jgi:Ca2+-transporting ATPase